MREPLKLTTVLLVTVLLWGALWIMAIGVALHWEMPQ